MPDLFRNAPQPPYYAVIFCAELTGVDTSDYRKTGDELLRLARLQPGFLGYEDFGAGPLNSFNVSYWESLEAIHAWKQHSDHLPAQAAGVDKWYQWYEVRIARVERAYSFDRE
jgi:heme-degrading monooxygenase HmoA